MPDDDNTYAWREGIKQGRKDLREQLLAWAREEQRLNSYTENFADWLLKQEIWKKVVEKLEKA